MLTITGPALPLMILDLSSPCGCKSKITPGPAFRASQFVVKLTRGRAERPIPSADQRDRRMCLGGLGLARFAAYLLSFTMLGTFWLAQHTLLSLCARSNRTLTWLQLSFLFVVTLLPFSASLLAEFAAVRLAVAAYWLNILLLGVCLALTCRYLPRGGLIDPGRLDRLSPFRRRIAVAQAGYATAALLCVANTYVSVAALALVELYFIVSPRVPPLDKLRRRRGGRPCRPR